MSDNPAKTKRFVILKQTCCRVLH